MQQKLSKLQKTILIYVGVTCKNQSKPYLKRTEVTIGMFDLLKKDNKKSFIVILTVALKGLENRRLVSRRGHSIGLTEEGKNNAKEIIDGIKIIYGKIDWNIVRDFYGSKKTK